MLIAWGILGFIAWIIIATWPAMVARKKGHSFVFWFILSLFFWWVTLFVVYFGLQDFTKTPEDLAADEAVREIKNREMNEINNK